MMTISQSKVEICERDKEEKRGQRVEGGGIGGVIHTSIS
jgi:hypothetical protein